MFTHWVGHRFSRSIGERTPRRELREILDAPFQTVDLLAQHFSFRVAAHCQPVLQALEARLFEGQLDEDRLRKYVTELEVTDAYDELRDQQRENTAQRRAFVKQWAEFVKTHSDEEWSAQQNKLIDSQIEG